MLLSIDYNVKVGLILQNYYWIYDSELNLICYNDLVSQNLTNFLEIYDESRFNKRTCRQVNVDVCNPHDFGEFTSTVL